MIKEIRIQNFQSHKDTGLELDKGVNSIIGSSDFGKTAILRAINWVVFNKPAGNEMRSFWGGDTEAALVLDDDLIVSRGKADKENYYNLNGQDFKAMGQGVPVEIKDALNLSELNIQYQLDAPFLLSGSAGEVARYLNQVSNLDIIDTALSNIEKMKREYSRKTQNAERMILGYNQELEQYRHLDDIEKRVQVAEAIDEELTSLSSIVDEMDSLLVDIEQVEEAIKPLKPLLSSEESLIEVEKIVDEISALSRGNATLVTLHSSITGHLSVLSGLEKLIGYEEPVKAFISLKDEYQKQMNALTELYSQVDAIDVIQKEIPSLDSILVNLEKELHDIMPEVCPLCLQSIKK